MCEIDLKKFDGIQTANTHTTKALQGFFDDYSGGPGPYMWPAEEHGFISMLHYVHALAATKSMYSYSETGPGNLKQYPSLSPLERAEHIGTCHANYVLYLAQTGRQRSDMSAEAAHDDLAQSGTWAALHMMEPEGDELEELEEPEPPDAANSDLSLDQRAGSRPRGRGESQAEGARGRGGRRGARRVGRRGGGRGGGRRGGHAR